MQPRAGRARLFYHNPLKALTLLPCWQVGGVEEYLARGPGFLFLFHPALGPLWDVISQKIRGGALAPGAELVLEVRPQYARAMHDVCTPVPVSGLVWSL